MSDRAEDSAQTDAGTMSGVPDAEDVSDSERQEIEEERRRRLDPENRPDNAEVDNTDRDFDPIHGHFTDHEPDVEVGPFPDPSESDG